MPPVMPLVLVLEVAFLLPVKRRVDQTKATKYRKWLPPFSNSNNNPTLSCNNSSKARINLKISFHYQEMSCSTRMAKVLFSNSNNSSNLVVPMPVDLLAVVATSRPTR